MILSASISDSRLERLFSTLSEITQDSYDQTQILQTALRWAEIVAWPERLGLEGERAKISFDVGAVAPLCAHTEL
jgi:hypothetical protein